MRIEYRDLTDEQLEEIDEKYAKDATPELVKEYIFLVWNVTEEEAKKLVEKHMDVIDNHRASGAWVYYVADVILNIELNLPR
jgi:hypothetical protein